MAILKVLLNTTNKINYIFENIEKDNPNKEPKILIAFYVMIADMIKNKILTPRLNYLLQSLVLLHNLILLYQKILDQILHTILLWKLQQELQQISFQK